MRLLYTLFSHRAVDLLHTRLILGLSRYEQTFEFLDALLSHRSGMRIDGVCLFATVGVMLSLAKHF